MKTEMATGDSPADRRMKKLIAELVEQAYKLEKQAFDARTEQEADSLRTHALWLRQKVSEFKGERLATGSTSPPRTVDE